MEKIKFSYANKEYYFKDILVFTGTLAFDLKYDINKLNDYFIKTIRHPNSYSLRYYKKMTDDELLKGMIIKELPKPSTFPIFNNEKPFKITFDGKTIINPTIIAIRWTGYIWEYRIKNIGHEYDYKPECMLEKI